MIELDGHEVKVGDRLWSMVCGWDEVFKLHINQEYPIIMFQTGSYTVHGSLTTTGPRCLYLDEVKIVPPPKPKRKVKKVLHGFMNVYPDDDPCMHKSKEIADSSASPRRIACIEINQEFEVEE